MPKIQSLRPDAENAFAQEPIQEREGYFLQFAHAPEESQTASFVLTLFDTPRAFTAKRQCPKLNYSEPIIQSADRAEDLLEAK